MAQGSNNYPIGVIHGRFQVLHNDHLRYLLAGKALCEHLVVGITNADPGQTAEESADPNRSRPAANPLTFYERYCLVRCALREAGIRIEHVSIVPFPIHQPDDYRHYVPMDAVFFLSIYDDWGRRKKAYFESRGLRIHVLREVSPAEKGISGTDLRAAMIAGRSWEHAVPRSVAELLNRWDIPARLQQMQSGQPLQS